MADDGFVSEALVTTVCDTLKELGHDGGLDPEAVVAIFSRESQPLEVRSIQFARDPRKLKPLRRTSIPSALYVKHVICNDLQLSGDELCFLEQPNPEPGQLSRRWVYVDSTLTPIYINGKIIATAYNPGPA